MSIIYVNKPKGITSFDVCYRLRKVFNTKKIGHSGTLDPNATGAMIVATDNDTKVIQFLKNDTKEYIATCTLGYETDTLDSEGKIVKQLDTFAKPTNDELNTVFSHFIGKQKQTPPMFSALRHNGKRLYDLARDNIEVEIKERDIEIYNIELLENNDNKFIFKCLVSSGTYIRVLLADILKELRLIGVLSDLERTMIGNVSLKQCYSLESIEKGDYKTYSSFDVLKDKYYVYEVNNVKDIMSGKPIIDNNLNEEYILVSNNSQSLAIYKKDKDKYTCIRGLF